jgi:hypothetical protein
MQMSERRKKLALTALHWILGIVVLVESLRLAMTSHEDHLFAKNALLHHIRPVLAWSETAAAVLFLVPFTTILGGWLLLLIFAFAALIHILHGPWEIGGLLIYAAAVIVVMTQRERNP